MELLPPREGRLTAIAFGQNRFLVAGTNGILFSSENGKDWARIPTRIQDDFEQVFYYQEVSDTGIGYGCFMAVGKSGALYGESEGRAWKRIASVQEGRFERFFHPAEGWSALPLDSGSLLYSTYGVDTAAHRWTQAWARTKSNLTAGAMGAGKWIAVGEHGAIVTISDSLLRMDSLHFTPVDARIRADLHDICRGGNRFVAVGDSGAILSSLDGEVWEKEESGTTGNLQGVAFGFNTFVAISENQLLLRKSDGAAGQDTSWVIGDDAVGAWLAPDQEPFRLGKLDSLRPDSCILSDSIGPVFSHWSLPVPALPAWGDGPGDFVPPGWFMRVLDSGDLNNDHLRDFAFVIEGGKPGLAMNEGKEDEKSFEILGILFGGNPDHKYRQAKQVDLISEEVGDWRKEYLFDCSPGEMSLGIMRDSLSITCSLEYGAGNFRSFQGVFKYISQDFRLVFSTESSHDGSLEYAKDSLDLISGRRRRENGNESEKRWRAPEIKEDTVFIPEPITFENFLEKWQGMAAFLTPEEMRKREKDLLQDGLIGH